MALVVNLRIKKHRYRAFVNILAVVQVAILFVFADPFKDPLPLFFNEVGPWFIGHHSGMMQIRLFMKLYPRMVFYYNAWYMWFHPPMLFLSYACITLCFASSVFVFKTRDQVIEQEGYNFARFGYFFLTLGMLIGYPWALKAWGPNWWWDPKICSSIMMWLVFSTYLHTRLYLNHRSMWYFSSILVIICFLAMIFTFLTSYYFPGEHTFQ